MTHQEQILNWLAVAFGQSLNKSGEDFFYDKRNNQFFSTVLFDYLLFDDDFNISPDVETSFSEVELLELGDRLKEIENGSSDILAIPKLTEDENHDLNKVNYVLKKAETFLSINNIRIETVTIWQTKKTGSITFDLNENNSDKTETGKTI